jgi:hypothetical protein
MFAGGKDMATDKHYFVERNAAGKFAVRARQSERASRLFDTQKEAEEYAHHLNSKDHADVERVRNTTSGARDRWRAA